MQARKIKDLGQIPVGAKVYTWAKDRETGRLWDAPKGLIIRKKKKSRFNGRSPSKDRQGSFELKFMPEEDSTSAASETPTAKLNTVAFTLFLHPPLFVFISSDTRLQKLATCPLNSGSS